MKKMKIKKREKRLIIGVVLIAVVSTFLIIRKDIKIEKLKTENSILLDTVTYSVKSNRCSVDLILLMKDNKDISDYYIKYHNNHAASYNDLVDIEIKKLLKNK